MWYYVSNNVQQGPVEETAIPQMIAGGTLSPNSLVWREGMKDWQTLGQSELSRFLAPAVVNKPAPTGPPPMRMPAQQAVNPYQPPQAVAYIPQPGMHRKMTWSQILWSFEGRIPRRLYWAGLGIWTGIIMLVTLLCVAISSGGKRSEFIFLPIILVFIPYIWSGIALQVKRWHDRDKSGAWFFIGLVPYIGGIWVLVECGCLRGTVGPNKYGPDPT
jgi:uncharacterized membrane protein YhaH (DUF805 family)